MKILFIGADPQTVETIGSDLVQRWPDAKIAQKPNVEDSLELVEGSSPDAVLLYADFPEIEPLVEAVR